MQSNFAEIAVELGLSDALPELAFGMLLEAMVAADRQARLEQLAARIGLSADATRRILHSEVRRAELIGEAHRLFRALIPHEAEVRALLSRRQEGKAA